MRSVLQSAAAAAVALFILAPAAAAADAEAGRAKAQVCAACHGADGNSLNPQWPSLAAQPAQFISTALFMFREGNRQDPLMTPMAKGLSNAEMNDLAAYFSTQKAPPPRHRSSAENAAAGPGLAKKFHCSQCHGPAMLGQQQIPRLAGPNYEYLRAQLRSFKAGTRAEMDGNMASATEPLTEQDIEILVDYLAGLGTQ